MTTDTELIVTVPSSNKDYPGDFCIVFESYRSAGYLPEVHRSAADRVYGYARMLTSAAVGIEFDEMLQADDETRVAWFGAYDRIREAMRAGFHFGKVSARGHLNG